MAALPWLPAWLRVTVGRVNRGRTDPLPPEKPRVQPAPKKGPARRAAPGRHGRRRQERKAAEGRFGAGSNGLWGPAVIPRRPSRIRSSVLRVAKGFMAEIEYSVKGGRAAPGATASGAGL